MINAEFLASCKDEQINFGVAWLEAKSDKSNCWRIPYNNMLFKNIINHEFEPCTNPNDIMPIAFANRIGLDSLFSGKWMALSPSWSSSGIESTNKNPLRAIAEVYILMSVNK